MVFALPVPASPLPQPLARIELASAADENALALAVQATGISIDARAELARPIARCWVARDEAALVAFIVTWHVVDEVHVIDVATVPAHRRRGLARALFETVLADARAQAMTRVLLEVRADNTAALALYEALGFEATNRRPRYYADGQDAIEMTLTLAPTASPAPEVS